MNQRALNKNEKDHDAKTTTMHLVPKEVIYVSMQYGCVMVAMPGNGIEAVYDMAPHGYKRLKYHND